MKIIKIHFSLFFTIFLLSVNLSKAQESKLKFSFGLIADIQYADKENSKTRFYKGSISKLEKSVAELNKKDLKFNVIFGDLVDQGPKDLAPVLHQLSKLKAPYKNVLGNHDFVGVKEKKDLYKTFNMPAPYYAFTKKGWTFIVLNTNELSEYGSEPNSVNYKAWELMADSLKKSGRKNVFEWNGGVNKVQLDWLGQQLQKAKDKKHNVFVFSHHPLYPETGYETLNNRELLNVIEKFSNVKAILAGHHHKGGFSFYKNYPVVTLEGMVETSDENAYGVLEVYDHEIRIQGTGRLTSRNFKF